MNRAEIEDLYPLSPQQQGMLFGGLRAGRPGLYVEQECHTLPLGLDTAAFRRAWERIVERHAMLRTAFVWREQEQPLQVVLRRAELVLEERDWCGRSRAEAAAQLGAYLAEDRARGFDLARPPLMRLALLRTDAGYEFVWTLHHIVMDGWCRPLLVDEFTALYGGLCRGAEPALPSPRPYRDYVAWLGRQDLAEAESFWTSTLAGFTRPTPLGRVEVSRPEPLDGAHASLDARLGPGPTDALRACARGRRLTLSTLVQGAWALLLSRYSGERDVVFGTTVAGRPPELEGSESMIGLFIQTLPFRVNVVPDQRLLPFLETVQADHLELRRLEHCSAGQVHQWSSVPASLPLYESLLVFENYPSGVPRDARPGGEVRFTGAQTAHPLTILAADAGGLTLRLIYDPRRIGAGSAARVLPHLGDLLAAIAADPDQPLSALMARVEADEIPHVLSPGGAAQPYVAPRTETERVVSRLWSEVLGIERVGVHDNFLELGGHSLIATQLMGRLRGAFQLDLPLRALFESADLAELAATVENAVLREIEALPEHEAERRLSETGPL